MWNKTVKSSHTDNHYHSPDTINVHEHKAPTDASIRLMEEAHDKAIKNIIAKVKVEDNLVNGECFWINQPWNIHEFKICYKFKINGKEFFVERGISRSEIGLGEQQEINLLTTKLMDSAKSIMLWYTLKMFAVVTYEQITGSPYPEKLLGQ